MSRVVDHSVSREWVDNAVRLIDADAQRSADTHLLRYPLPGAWGVQLYLKDESTHITGSLKHRLARSLFLYAICNGWVTENTTVIEASSGSTAVSEAYFARLLGLKFVAIMPRSTSPAKIALIESHGGRCHFVDDPASMYTEAHRLAAEPHSHYMDQFTHAERATDWRGNNNIAESIFDQLGKEESPIPTWIVVGAGTGGTSATIGRYIRYRRHATRLAVVDPENSAFIGGYETGDAGFSTGKPSRIEGIGRPIVEPSFVGQVIDRMIAVPDAASVAAARHASTVLGRRVGGSTGTNLWGAFGLISDMIAAGKKGSVVTLLCDGGERYAGTYFDDDWVAGQGMDLTGPTATLEGFARTGEFRV
ncbi:PLP-dependent cysteine synthase family protein [Rhodococcus sp. BP-252]|uniref:L-cysteine desulfhydrase Cds1 n=1 Tax=Rhodococcoides kyotonense TaxID=398843 RepID=A0A177YDN2_9NOCA|nr:MULTISPECIES: PLP-dependent cysteine synthase family protein [Rhodococcus]NIL76272.1 Cysteine synthase [Rhodococcus sp. B10]MBY6413607.1 PLP-dependent cysteine synthase family protein [Rhodococcus sp. BP-320]MBY6418406.1 PLP-dependent cysteine synthase family protein [Rhodococcus sp. BP-321]MBY6422531.1 PLP-dependent cysteine synthase family protein [Rhodococcus sp. BP-324]MBY6428351.1 PLP-dependent cysteine synthase family protein [Rhodococcus sp. BP-323]